MRLFRQKSAGDWEGVFVEIQAALLEQLTLRTNPVALFAPKQIAER